MDFFGIDNKIDSEGNFLRKTLEQNDETNSFKK